MSEQQKKVEELMQKNAALAKSKNKAKTAYFKLKKDQECDKAEIDKLNAEISSLREQLKLQSVEMERMKENFKPQDTAKLIALTREEELEGNNNTMEKLETNTDYLSIDLRQKLVEMEKEIELKNAEMKSHMELITSLRAQIQEERSVVEQQREEANEKKRKQDQNRKEILFAEKERRLLELRVKDLTRKREIANKAYTSLEMEYNKLRDAKQQYGANLELPPKDRILHPLLPSHPF
jgi:chromosome segregation ATPase